MSESERRTVTPVYREIDNGELDFVGSAVLLGADNKSVWLVSAAHVLAEIENSRLVVAPNGMHYFYLVIDSIIYSTCDLTLSNAHRDPHDLGFVRLDSTTVGRLAEEGFSAFPMENAETSIEAANGGPCILNGYPCEISRMENGAPVSVVELRVASALFSNVEAKRRFKIDANTHIAAPYGHLLDSDKSPVRTPDPLGMSGGAVWVTVRGAQKLAGIIIEYDHKRRAIVAARVGPVIQRIRQLIA